MKFGPFLWQRSDAGGFQTDKQPIRDEEPLASLPLIGYAVTKPDENDNINKELVIKLQYKTHIYFFRADSEYSFFRWMEVICSATQSSSRTRLFSRQTSILP